MLRLLRYHSCGLLLYLSFPLFSFFFTVVVSGNGCMPAIVQWFEFIVL